jgi:hypothetical protein
MKKFNPELCTVIVENGEHFIITPKGEKIHYIIFTRVEDCAGEAPTCIIKLLVNIGKNE